MICRDNTKEKKSRYGSMMNKAKKAVSNSVRVKAEEEGGNIWKDYMRRIMNEENDE